MSNNFNTSMIAAEINNVEGLKEVLAAFPYQDIPELAEMIRDEYFDKCKNKELSPFAQAILDNALDNVDWLYIAEMIC